MDTSWPITSRRVKPNIRSAVTERYTGVPISDGMCQHHNTRTNGVDELNLSDVITVHAH